MTAKDDKRESFVSRWSRRKLAAVREADAPRVPSAAASAVPATASSAVSVVAQPAAPAVPEVPAVGSLTFDSDFTAFMQPGIDPATRQAALRKLLRDPRFNAMDGLDVYIDDYTRPAPLDPALARRLADALFTPTRINEQGHAEDIPPEARTEGEGARPQHAPSVTGDPEVSCVADQRDDRVASHDRDVPAGAHAQPIAAIEPAPAVSHEAKE